MLCGVDTVLQEAADLQLHDQRVGLVTNAASFTKDFQSSKSFLCSKLPITDLFAPEHGLGSFIGDGKDVEDQRDAETGLAVHSLYASGGGKVDAALFKDIDTILFDIQDVGLRFYTYIATLEQLLKQGKPVIVLDRPNPLGGLVVEGPMLPSRYASFVGLSGLPARYGLTIGELAAWMQDAYGYAGPLRIVETQNVKRGDLWPDNGRSWIMTSPALAHIEAVFLYAGFCLLEGTNLSEGRGTSAPFELFGAPFIDSYRLAREVNALGLEGVAFTAVSFVPNQSKHQGQVCHGLYAHVLDFQTLRPFTACLSVLSVIHRLYPDQLAFNGHFAKLAGFESQAIFAHQLGATLQKAAEDEQTFRKQKRRFERYGN